MEVQIEYYPVSNHNEQNPYRGTFPRLESIEPQEHQFNRIDWCEALSTYLLVRKLKLILFDDIIE